MPSAARRLVVVLLIAIAYAHASSVAAAQVALPPALASLHEFRGRVDYTARRDGSTAAIDGSLVVTPDGWTLDERTPTYDLRAGEAGARITFANGTDAAVADLFDSDVLSNAWAALLGELATGPVAASGQAAMWNSGSLRVFLDPAAAQIIGLREAGIDDVAYSLDDWWTVGPLEVPHRILRLRGGVPEASYSVTDYRIAASVDAAPRAAQPYAPSLHRPTSGVVDLFAAVPPIDVGWAQRAATIAFTLLVLALGIVAWSRRDAWIAAWCTRIARDPRGWRTTGISIFVEPDGTLFVDGSRYRIGAAFYGRAALVQRSALFIRVTSPAVPHAVVLPRRFTKTELGVRPHAERRTTAGFTLIETMVASALFAAIVLLAVYPAIAAVARADAMASERARAAIVAANALSDEETASAYGGVAFGTTTTTADGLVLSVSVSPGSVKDESDLDVVVTDPDGHVLAHVVSWLGIAVVAPPGSGGGPPQP